MDRSNSDSLRLSLQCWCVLVSSLSTIPAHAELTANLALTTDYIYRGISNSNRHPALQGGVDYTHQDGWYAGSWLSNVDFDDGGEAKAEVDGYLGHAGRVGQFSWNAGWMAYVYPGARSSLRYDTHRVSFSGQYDLSGKVVGLYVDRINNVFGSGPAYYLEGSLTVPLRAELSLDMRLGRQRYTDNIYLTMPDFTYRSVALSWQSDPWETRLAWQNNGVVRAACFVGKSWCGPAWLLQLTRRFELGKH